MDFSDTELDALLAAAVEAGEAAAGYIRSKQGERLEVDLKQGGESYGAQVVTAVDRHAQEIILSRLSECTGDFDLAVLSEELPDDGARLRKRAFWCIDPLDGTLPFIEGRKGYSVSIALASQDGEPMLGVIVDPLNEVVYAAAKGRGSTRNGQLFAIPNPGEKPAEVCIIVDDSGRSHPKYESVKREIRELGGDSSGRAVVEKEGGGAALNVCWVAEKAPACFFKLPKKENGCGCVWDYAAAICVFEEAGGFASDVYGKRIQLNPVGSLYMNRTGIVFASEACFAERIVKAIDQDEL